MINGMERFTALSNGQLPDRVPVVCNLFEQGALELGMPIKEYYSKGEYVAEGQLKLRAKYGYDTVWGFHYVAKTAEILGAKKTLFSDNGPPNVGHMIIKDYSDIEKFNIPDLLEDNPKFLEELKTIKILKDEVGGKYPICAYVTSSLSLPPILMGIEKWIDLLVMGPKSIRDELLEKCSDYCKKKISAVRAAGVDFISYSNPISTATFIDLKQFDDIALPWIKKDIGSGSNADLVFFCGGGNLYPMLDKIISNTNIKTYYISPYDDIKGSKKLLQNKGLLVSSINDIKLIDGTKEEIEEDVKRIMGEGSPGGSFVFGTLLMPFLIPDEKIKIMLEAAYRYGTYKT